MFTIEHKCLLQHVYIYFQEIVKDVIAFCKGTRNLYNFPHGSSVAEPPPPSAAPVSGHSILAVPDPTPASAAANKTFLMIFNSLKHV